MKRLAKKKESRTPNLILVAFTTLATCITYCFLPAIRFKVQGGRKLILPSRLHSVQRNSRMLPGTKTEASDSSKRLMGVAKSLSDPIQSTLRTLPPGIWALGLVSMFMDMSSELVHILLPVLWPRF